MYLGCTGESHRQQTKGIPEGWAFLVGRQGWQLGPPPFPRIGEVLRTPFSKGAVFTFARGLASSALPPCLLGKPEPLLGPRSLATAAGKVAALKRWKRGA